MFCRAGLALFLSVPRHVFAQVQQVLFPLYFLSNAVLMLVAVVTYTRHHPTHLWDNHQMMQVRSYSMPLSLLSSSSSTTLVLCHA